MLLDLSSIKEGIASIKQTLAGLGSEGYYKAPPSLTDAYKVGEMGAYSKSLQVTNGASETRRIGGMFTMPLKDGFYPSLNGVLGVKITGTGYITLLPPPALVQDCLNWRMRGTTDYFAPTDFLYFLNADGGQKLIQEYHQYNSNYYTSFIALRQKLKQETYQFYIPCLKGVPLVPSWYTYKGINADSTGYLDFTFNKIEFFAEVIKS